MLLLLRSRASIIGFFVCVFYIVISKEFNKKLKTLFSVAILIVIVLILTNDGFYNTFINNILLAGRDASSLDNLTSGRVTILRSFDDLIDNHWLMGIGATYFECFPISAILQFGIITGAVIIGIAYFPSLYAYRIRNKNYITKIFFLICIGYVFNSFFEGLAPIGPGVKCYFMWLLFGILYSKRNKGSW